MKQQPKGKKWLNHLRRINRVFEDLRPVAQVNQALLRVGSAGVEGAELRLLAAKANCRGCYERSTVGEMPLTMRMR